MWLVMLALALASGAATGSHFQLSALRFQVSAILGSPHQPRRRLAALRPMRSLAAEAGAFGGPKVWVLLCVEFWMLPPTPPDSPLQGCIYLKR